MKVFTHYYEAVMHCVNKDIQEYRGLGFQG